MFIPANLKNYFLVVNQFTISYFLKALNTYLYTLHAIMLNSRHDLNLDINNELKGGQCILIIKVITLTLNIRNINQLIQM